MYAGVKEGKSLQKDVMNIHVCIISMPDSYFLPKINEGMGWEARIASLRSDTTFDYTVVSCFSKTTGTSLDNSAQITNTQLW